MSDPKDAVPEELLAEDTAEVGPIRGPGRPPKPEEQKRNKPFTVMLTADEHADALLAAAKAGKRLNVWGRDVLLEAAQAAKE